MKIYGIKNLPRPYKALPDAELARRRAIALAGGVMTREVLDLNGEHALRNLSRRA